VNARVAAFPGFGDRVRAAGCEFVDLGMTAVGLCIGTSALDRRIHGMVRSSRRGLHRVRHHPAPQETEPEELKENEPVTAQQSPSQ
jgi:hypothetical protein